jgi:membrane protease YdiL (CAAX protease family)
MLRRVRRALSLADSPIGAGLSRPVAIAMAVLATLVVAHDLKLLGDFDYWGGRRDIPPAIAIAVFVYLARDNLDAIGVRVRPLPSLRFWLVTVVVLAMIMTVLIAGTIAVYVALDKPMPPPVLPDYDHFFGAVVDAPLVEESIYRWLFVTGIVAVARRGAWAGVVLSGAVFAYLHFVYNNPGPDNFIGGYFFAWMYLRSGSILVPIAFHALANGTLIILNVIAFHVLS